MDLQIYILHFYFQLYNALKGKHPNYTVYLKEDLPHFWFYKNHRRILPIVVVGDEGWQISPVSTARHFKQGSRT